MHVLRSGGFLNGPVGAPEPLDPFARMKLYPDIAAELGMPLGPDQEAPAPAPPPVADDPNFNAQFWHKQLDDALGDGRSDEPDDTNPPHDYAGGD